MDVDGSLGKARSPPFREDRILPQTEDSPLLLRQLLSLTLARQELAV